MSFEDHWIEVNKVPTRVLTWGAALKDLEGVKDLFLCISGNPGLTGYYVTFLEALHKKTGSPVWMISHAGHELPPSSQKDKMTLPKLSDKSNESLFNLQGQIQHKQLFIQTYIPSHINLYLIGHSVGAKMIMDLLKVAPHLGSSIGGVYLLFPTLERIRNTPAADVIVPLLTYLTPVILFLSSIFRLFPRAIQRFLISTTFFLQHCKSADPYCVDATVDLIHSRVLRHVFFLAMDEMERIKELDVETLDQHASKLRIYFGANDDWCPVSFYSNLKDKCPTVRADLCQENIKHAFVLNCSDIMADKVAAWYEEDRRSHDEIMTPS